MGHSFYRRGAAPLVQCLNGELCHWRCNMKSPFFLYSIRTFSVCTKERCVPTKCMERFKKDEWTNDGIDFDPFPESTEHFTGTLTVENSLDMQCSIKVNDSKNGGMWIQSVCHLVQRGIAYCEILHMPRRLNDAVEEWVVDGARVGSMLRVPSEFVIFDDSETE